MASKQPRPGRTLTIFLLVIAAMFGMMAALKAWTPKLGLDLRGGTTITLTARNSNGAAGAPSKDNMDLARQIIERRVNALGVGETSVTQAGNQIVVAVPNANQKELVDLVGTTAQLNFRQVLLEVPNQTAPEPTPTATASSTASPAATAQTTAKGTAAPATAKAAPAPTASASGNPRPFPGLPTATPAPKTPRPTEAGQGKLKTLAERLTYQMTPQDQEDLLAFNCNDKFPDVVDQPLITCSEDKAAKYLLGPVLIEGKEISGATAGIPQNELNWQVDLEFKSTGANQFSEATSKVYMLEAPKNQLAVVLDGKVVSAPRIEAAIAGGRAQITGNFTQKSATDLANKLKFGALPVALTTESVDNVSSSLGSDQLRAGIIAGLIGLALVVLYAFFYYRGLGIVVIASLAIAALMTYAVLVLLGQSMDLALNLPGIAGAIVAIGVTADSFIIYFERIRDEVREGRSLRTAIETGWRKARPTIVIADCVSLLSALILFVVAVGAVRGFAFTLGITTFIDLAIIFWFTKPMVSLLGRTKFFGEGHRGSGLEAEHMGVDHLNTGRVVRNRRTLAKES